MVVTATLRNEPGDSGRDGASRAIVAEAKVRDYLLSSEHPVGRFKARVFAAVGYRRDAWERFRDDLLALAIAIDVTQTRNDQFGQRFIGTETLISPAGTALPVHTVWLIPSQGDPPRLITAYPESAL